MKFQNGFLYKTTSLQDSEREAVLQFLNNQTNATQAVHLIVLNHIRQYGTGNIDMNVQTKMLQQQSLLQTIEKGALDTPGEVKEEIEYNSSIKPKVLPEVKKMTTEANKNNNVDTTAF